MAGRIVAVVLGALLAHWIAQEAVANQPGRLDLRLDPRVVEDADAMPPPHDLVGPPSRGLSAQVGPPPALGWSLRPRLDLDLVESGVEAGSGNQVDLGDLDLELNSVGVRLQRRW